MNEAFEILFTASFWVAAIRIASPLIFATMGELLCAIEEDREPENSARENLRSLELCFAALASADSGQPVKPGDVLEFVMD